MPWKRRLNINYVFLNIFFSSHKSVRKPITANNPVMANTHWNPIFSASKAPAPAVIADPTPTAAEYIEY